MLLELRVKDIALIRQAEAEFAGGLNILTGETGAGKSIIIGSVALALGAKAKSELVREGAENAYIELTVKAEDEALLEKLRALSVAPQEDGTLIISRRLSPQRSTARINDETVTLARLKEVTGLFVDIYGQHEYQALLDSKKHLEILDEYCHADIAALLDAVRKAYAAHRALKKKCAGFDLDEEARLREMDFAAFEIGEIEAAAVKDGEEEALAARYKKLSHARVIAEQLFKAQGYLSENSVSEALSALSAACEYDEALSLVRDQLYDAESILQEAARDLRQYADNMETDEAVFSETEERLDLIRSIMAKYGKTAAAIEAYREKKAARLSELRDYEENKRNCEAACEEAYARLKEACAALTEKRKKGAERLSEAVCAELLDLGFESVRLELAFSEKEPGEDGADEICFMTALNPGERLKPITEVASGGELSRVMLAIKTVLAETDRTPVLIFDEIDAGISGRTAQKVAEKLSLIAKRHQVLCITHLPQIAAMADTHFLIEKSETDGRSETRIERLSEEASLSELSRLLGGAEITEAVRKNAAEMKALAEERKKLRG